MIWDAGAGAPSDPILDGIEFTNDRSHRRPSEFAFQTGEHALLRDVSGRKYEISAECSSSPSVGRSSAEWSELAYTVLSSVSSGQFYSGDAPFGPRWVSLMDPARVPLALARKYGRGEIVFAQLGTCEIRPKADGAANEVERAPLYLRALAKNLITWAGETEPQSSNESGQGNRN